MSSEDSHDKEATDGISIRNLHKRFRREGSDETVVAVDDVSVDVTPGELLVLLGPSGCGKTTLLRCVAGLETPNAGRIAIGTRTVFSSEDGTDVRTNKRDISMIFQSYSLWPHMSVDRNVSYPLQSRGKWSRSELTESVESVLRLVGLEGLGREYPGTLSGGQQQRVALARALITDPAVILFDEPLSNIDAQVRSQLRDEISSMHRRIGFSGIYVTHDQAEALSLGTKIAVLRQGRVIQIGTPDDVYNRPASKYVAEFVGRANCIAGTVGRLESAVMTVESPIGELVIPQAAASSEFAPGQSVFVVIRPEDIAVSSDAPHMADTITLDGTVSAHAYQGAHHDLTVSVRGHRIMAETPKQSGVLSLDKPVKLLIDPTAIRVVDQ